jgi:hypothetical protein
MEGREEVENDERPGRLQQQKPKKMSRKSVKLLN